ncbi:MAG: AAA family ATPase [Proteobacteria bacterium]|nr:AAA family ATPase [Pseudomonadota bacterium]
MLFSLICAGISLTGTAISWWNEQRTAEVRAQIQALEEDYKTILGADAAGRKQLAAPYIADLKSLITVEVKMRQEVDADLTQALAHARSIKDTRFGAREGTTLQRATLELEMALGQIRAELAWLDVAAANLDTIAADRFDVLPSATALQLPLNFPREGGIVQLDSQDRDAAVLHGYTVRKSKGEAIGPGRYAVVEVDHRKRTVILSTSKAALMDANLSDGHETLTAVVKRRDREGLHLETDGIALMLPLGHGAKHESIQVDAEIEVYPELWTLDDIRRASSDTPLRVRLHPHVEGSRTRWTSIPLAVSDHQLPLLAQVVEQLDAIPDSDSPWRVHLLPSGQLAFSLGNVTLETTANLKSNAFDLQEVRLDADVAEISIKIHAQLSAFVRGTPDEEALDLGQFSTFLGAIRQELGTRRDQVSQRRTALRLRKLSMIYLDQEEHLRSNGSVGVVVTGYQSGGRVLTVLLVGGATPPWIEQAINTPAECRLRACTQVAEFAVKTVSWIDQRMSLLRLELLISPTASVKDIAPSDVRRLEIAGEGSQQQTLSRALERTIAGRFVSPVVHETLLGLSGEPVPTHAMGTRAVEQLLASEAELVAIWGPPGTGKTTMLVKWLLSIFPQDAEDTWPTVLISAPTHVAVTKLLVDLLQRAQWLSVHSVRYASPERIEGSGLQDVWHVQLLKDLYPDKRDVDTSQGPGQRWAEVLRTRQGREAAAKWLLGPRHFHAATCIGMARRDYGLWERKFDIAIIDEAGKAFGAELMIPCSVARRIVMVGDHNQLPPTITPESLNPEIPYRLPFKEVQELLEKNTFQQIFEQLTADKKGMLTRQHRMHSDIGNLVSELFYDGKLTSARTGGTWTLTRSRVMFLDFSGMTCYSHRKAQGTSSQENPAEREALMALLESLDQNKQEAVRSVLVVCPYEAQRQAVARAMRDMRYAFSVKATTVDAVQGSEADMVILLMTRSRGPVQFLLDRHRLNVAMSRAREAVIVFGHLACLTPQQSGPISRMLELGLNARTLELVKVRNVKNPWRALAKWVVSHQP